jgi:soluble lytic murein transglycosylase
MKRIACLILPLFQKLYKSLSIILCVSTPLFALSPQMELQKCKPALLAQLNQQKRVKAEGCPVSQKLITWLGIIRDADQFTPKELAIFLNSNSHWPHHEKLCRLAEETITKKGSPEEIFVWFENHPPQTPLGALAYAKAHMRLKEKTKAAKVILTAWRTMDMTKAEESKYVTSFGHLLQEKEHLARLNMLLWNGDVPTAKRLLVHIPIATRKVAEIRLAFLEGKTTEALKRMQALPAQLRNNEGLLYEKVKYYRKQDEVQPAVQILLKTSVSPAHAAQWWKERNYFTRELIALQDYQTAYKLLRNHHLEAGSEDFATAEWLMGWLSLRFLNRPNEAKQHFETVLANVKGAISKARGAYWMGRVYEAQHNNEQAAKWYSKAAKYKTTYYGQLAAAKIQEAPYPSLAKAPSATAEEKKRFEQKDIVQAVHLLKGLGSSASHELSKFLLHIADKADNKAERELSVMLAHAYSPYDVVWTAKKAGYAEPITLAKAYPTVTIPKRGQRIPEKALVMAITYQESRFNPTAVSSAGATGLMQFMPSTASQEAKRIGIKHSVSKLTDPSHNVTLGSSHLSHLLDEFNGSYILATAAYNAGNTPIHRWLAQLGNPHQGKIDVVDWIELIPYGETRNYVMRVLENVTLYRSLDGAPKKTLIEDLKS